MDTETSSRTGTLAAVSSFDPLSAQPHDPDIRALLRVCNVHNVPLAMNVATADLVIASLAPCRAETSSSEGAPLLKA